MVDIRPVSFDNEIRKSNVTKQKKKKKKCLKVTISMKGSE